MSSSPIGVVIGVVVLFAAIMIALLSYRYRRHMRSWQDRYTAFVRGHQQLDRERDRVWQLVDV